MKTLFAIVVLAIFGIAAAFLSIYFLNLAGLPGALLAGKPGARSKARFVTGSLVAAAGQTYAYLAYAAFVVNWTLLAARRDDVVGWPLWPVAFLVVLVPLWMALGAARLEARESEHANPQVEALHLTLVLVLTGFFTFAFAPVVLRLGWGWVPYVQERMGPCLVPRLFLWPTPSVDCFDGRHHHVAQLLQDRFVNRSIRCLL